MRWEDLVARVGVIQLDLIKTSGFTLYRFGPHSQITEQRLENHRNRFPLDERFL